MYRYCNNNIIITLSGISYQLREGSYKAEIASSPEAQGNIYIPRSIEYLNQQYTIILIGSEAFKNNKNISTISIAEDSLIREIKDSAFQKSSITKITIPSSISRIGDKCFDQCENLQTVEFLPNSQLSDISYRCFSQTSITTIKIPSNVMTIEKETFSECTNLKSIEILPDSNLSAIFRYAFSNSQIESLTIPPKLYLLDDGWCEKTPKLNKLILPEKSSYLTLVNDKLLIGKSDKNNDEFDLLHFACRDISGDVTIPSYVREIGCFCFEGCSQIHSIRFESNSMLRKIDVAAFQSSKVNKIDLPPTVTKIERDCFYCCSDLHELSIPSSVTEIGCNCFSNCTNLKKVNFSPDSKITKINDNTFFASGIECISIPSSVTLIGNNAFYTCKRLKSIQIPFESNLSLIEKNAFSSSSIEFLSIPSKLEKFDENWCYLTPNFSSFSLSPENNFFKEIEGKMIVGKSKIIDEFYENFVFAVRTIEYVTVPSYITTLRNSSLSNCTKLKSVTFRPNSKLTTIENYTFSFSSLKGLNLPKSYKNMIRGTLDECEQLSSIEFLADSIEIDNYCLNMVQNLTIISAPNAKKLKISDYNNKTDFTIFLLPNAITEFEINESECVPY